MYDDVSTAAPLQSIAVRLPHVPVQNETHESCDDVSETASVTALAPVAKVYHTPRFAPFTFPALSHAGFAEKSSVAPALTTIGAVYGKLGMGIAPAQSSFAGGGGAASTRIVGVIIVGTVVLPVGCVLLPPLETTTKYVVLGASAKLTSSVAPVPPSPHDTTVGDPHGPFSNVNRQSSVLVSPTEITSATGPLVCLYHTPCCRPMLLSHVPFPTSAVAEA
jgi:hypothetical protein